MDYLAVLVFVLGTCVGSFLNVCIYRIPAGESVVSPPSHCMNCGNRLRLPDLIPVVSFLVLRGKCRYCGAGVSRQYPLVELVTGLLFLAAWLCFGYTWHTLVLWVLFSVLVTVSVIDYHSQIIPDRVVLAGLVLGLLPVALQSWQVLLSGIYGLLAAGLFLLAVAVVSRGGMGGGDIKLGAVMGLLLGLQNLAIALFLAFLTGGLVGLVLMLLGRKGRKDAVPFGPFLAFGAVLAALGGDLLSSWYWGLWL